MASKLIPVIALLIGAGIGVAATWKLGVEPERAKANGTPGKLQEAENRVADLLGQVQDWEAKAKAWEAQVQALPAQFQGQLDSAKAEAEKLRGELTTQAAALTQQFDSQLAGAKAETEQLKNQLGTLTTDGQAKLDALQKNLTEQTAAVAAKDQALTAAQAQSAALQKKTDDLTKEVKRLNDTLLLLGGKK
jgi:chromosome segregation ATPase